MAKKKPTKQKPTLVKKAPTPVAMVDVSGLLLAKSRSDSLLTDAMAQLRESEKRRRELEQAAGEDKREIVRLQEHAANIEASQIPQIKEVCSAVVKAALSDAEAIQKVVGGMIEARLTAIFDSPQSAEIVEEAIGRAAFRLATESLKNNEKIDLAKEAILKASVAYFEDWIKENKATFDPKRLLELNGCRR